MGSLPPFAVVEHTHQTEGLLFREANCNLAPAAKVRFPPLVRYEYQQ